MSIEGNLLWRWEKLKLFSLMILKAFKSLSLNLYKLRLRSHSLRIKGHELVHRKQPFWGKVYSDPLSPQYVSFYPFEIYEGYIYIYCIRKPIWIGTFIISVKVNFLQNKQRLLNKFTLRGLHEVLDILFVASVKVWIYKCPTYLQILGENPK